jgi:hypothetical protein
MENQPMDPVAIEDKICYLYLLNKMPQKKWTNMQANKMVFLAKYYSFLDNQLIIRMNFKRNHKGPTSKHVWDIKRELAPNQIIDQFTTPGYQYNNEFAAINSESTYILEEIGELWEIYPWVSARLDNIISNFSVIDTQELRNIYIYPLELHGKTIGEYPVGDYFNMRVRTNAAQFQLSKSWKETLILFFTPGFKNQMELMEEDLRNTTWEPFQPLQ